MRKKGWKTLPLNAGSRAGKSKEADGGRSLYTANRKGARKTKRKSTGKTKRRQMVRKRVARETDRKRKFRKGDSERLVTLLVSLFVSL